MINAHPNIDTVLGGTLPEGVPIVIVQGAKENVWPKPRGYTRAGQLEDGSLEALIRTGSPHMCYLYYTIEMHLQAGHREGDDHTPKSLLKDDCLARLVDALISARPAYTFLTSSALRGISEERRAAEAFLGYHPDQLRRFWVPQSPEYRLEVAPSSDEYKKVAAIFHAEPPSDSPRCYHSRYGVDGKTIKMIERVQNGQLQDRVDMNHGLVSKNLIHAGIEYRGGVHSRWLFHGCGSPTQPITAGTAALKSIITNPDQGFEDNLNSRSLFGVGSYFARDATYPVHEHLCCQSDRSGVEMIMLCLVECGLSCVGEEHMKSLPRVHPNMPLNYASYVDHAANPEFYVVRGENAYPAYIIHYE